MRRRIIGERILRTVVRNILVRTDDFQLAYRIMQMLRTRNISVEQSSMNQPLPSKDTIWIGTVDEVAEKSAEGRPIAADIESLDVAIESAIFALKGSRNTHRFILGVDTGPRPGLAWFTDGVLIDTKQTESVDACIELIQSLIEHHEFEFQNECHSCIGDQVSNVLELTSYHLFFSHNIGIEQISFYEKKNQSYFLSRAPPQ